MILTKQTVYDKSIVGLAPRKEGKKLLLFEIYCNSNFDDSVNGQAYRYRPQVPPQSSPFFDPIRGVRNGSPVSRLVIPGFFPPKVEKF